MDLPGLAWLYQIHHFYTSQAGSTEMVFSMASYFIIPRLWTIFILMKKTFEQYCLMFSNFFPEKQ